MTGRRSFGATVAVGAACAGLAAAAANQTWVEATTSEPAIRTVAADGTAVAPVVLPLALVSLAAWGAILVLRAKGRRVVAVVGLLSALGAAAAVVLSAGTASDTAVDLLGSGSGVTTEGSAWPIVAGVALVLTSGAFAVALLRAGRWPEMSSRYDAPGGRTGGRGDDRDDGDHADTEMSDAELWRAIDEGRDPTA